MRDPETGKGGYVPSDMTYQEWKARYVDKSGERGIINTYPGKSDSRHTNEISQAVKAKVTEAESTVVHDIPSLSGWHEPIAFGKAAQDPPFEV